VTGAYYNENDPKAAAWLRELIRYGHIAPGDVDERSIEDVLPRELAGYTQCHFFAGIGGWSYALRLAGWADDRAVWTGSCPCQPFSAAGKGLGFADERHLWPSWFHLISQLSPIAIFGEQVASPAGLAWFDVVHADLEKASYAVGGVDLCAASVGAPHIRQRLYWVAHHHHLGRVEHPERDGPAFIHSEESARGGDAGGRGELGDAGSSRSGRHSRAIPRAQGSVEREVRSESDEFESSSIDRLAHAAGKRLEVVSFKSSRGERAAAERSRAVGELADDRFEGRGQVGQVVRGSSSRSGAQRLGERLVYGSPWDNPEWLPCRDGKSRPVEPGTFPLAHGVPERVGLLRGYGNAIVPQVAAAFIEATGLV
jgi:DNA (cytosine-5)-methyltransferase 1